MAKLILDNALIEEDFFEDSRLWAIGSSAPAHALCWWLNQSFGLNFYRTPELDVRIRNLQKRPKKAVANSLFDAIEPTIVVADEIVYPVYHHIKPNTKFELFLYGNKIAHNTLLPEFKTTDFLLLIKDSNYLQAKDDFTQLLNKLHVISWEKEIDLDSLKGKINLII